MKTYLTLTDAESEAVVSRSRFISYLYHITDEGDAKDKLQTLRKKHYDATHICYAYIADEDGHVTKASDDGEPSGTAGAPILTALGGYRKALIAVVRYFGGTKLGVGGLVKAYSDAAAAVIGRAEVKEFFESNVFEITLSYNEFEKCRKALSRCKVISTEYADCIKCEFAAKSDTDIVKELTDILGAVPMILLIEKSRYIEY